MNGEPRSFNQFYADITKPISALETKRKEAEEIEKKKELEQMDEFERQARERRDYYLKMQGTYQDVLRKLEDKNMGTYRHNVVSEQPSFTPQISEKTKKFFAGRRNSMGSNVGENLYQEAQRRQ